MLEIDMLLLNKDKSTGILFDTIFQRIMLASHMLVSPFWRFLPLNISFQL
jgi:hypothetical protein